MAEFRHFPSIQSFGNFVEELKEHHRGDELLDLEGTVKLHGSHADVVWDASSGETWFQSRNRVVTLGFDNAGFVQFMQSVPLDKLKQMVEGVYHGPVEKILLAAEICGGSVQKNVALQKLPKMVVLYAIKVNNQWEDFSKYKDVELPEHRVYNIYRAPTFHAQLDPRNPSLVYPKLMELTNHVENECPFALALGVHGTGEGIVWRVKQLEQHSSMWFKTKGDKHCTSVTTKREASTKAKHAKEFAVDAVQPRRLEQGLEYLTEHNIKHSKEHLGTFLKWLVDDTLREEQLAIKEGAVDIPSLRREISQIGKQFYLNSGVL